MRTLAAFSVIASPPNSDFLSRSNSEGSLIILLKNRPHNKKTITHRYEYAQFAYHTRNCIHSLGINAEELQTVINRKTKTMELRHTLIKRTLAEKLKTTILKAKPWSHIQSFQKHNAHAGLRKVNQGI